MRKISQLACVVSIATLSITGCGGGGSSSTGGSGGISPGAAGSTDKSAAMTAAGNKWDSISHANAGVASTQMAAWLKTQTAFSNSGVSDDFTVWATFKDGTGVAFADDSLFNPSASSKTATLAVAAQTRLAIPAVPTGTTAYLFQGASLTLNPSKTGSDIRPQLSAMLQKAGYTVVSATGTLADYQAISPANSALLWTNTDGGMAMSSAGGAAPATHYFMLSSTVVPANEPIGSQNDLDLKAGRLLPIKLTGQPYVYEFSGAWLQVRVHFGQNSIWINNACEGAQTDEMSGGAFHVGLSAYVGWDESVIWSIANDAAMYLVDRMSGTNLDPTNAPEPPQRPFDLEAVVTDMAGLSPPLTISSVYVPPIAVFYPPPYNTAHSITAHLTTAYNSFNPIPTDQFALLAPSIRYMNVQESTNGTAQLDILGEFGSQQGEVTIGGQPASVVSWGSGGILCNLPVHGSAGDSGDVQVTANGHKSNVVQLTEWAITFHQVDALTYSGIAPPIPNGPTVTYSGSQEIDTDLKIWLRADIHDSRSKPGETLPFQQPGERYTTEAGSLLPFLDGEFTSWNGSGTETIQTNYPDNSMLNLTETITYGGAAGSPPAYLTGSDPRSGRGVLFGTYMPQNRNLQLLFQFGMQNFISIQDIVTSEFGTTLNNSIGSSVSVTLGEPQESPFVLTLDASGTIPGGSMSSEFRNTGLFFDDKVTVTWQATPAMPGTAPDPNAARSGRTLALRSQSAGVSGLKTR